MARIQLGGIISDIKGSIGGTTFSRCRSGHIGKSKAIQPKANSRYRNALLSISAQVSGNWSKLSASDRISWNAYATMRNHTSHKRLGTLQTGYDFFRSVNFWRLASGITLLSSPALTSYDVNFLAVLSVEGAPNFYINFDRSIVPADEFLAIKMSAPVKGSQNAPNTLYKTIVDTITADPFFDYEGAYTSRFGILPVAGQRIFVSVSPVSLASGFMFPLLPVAYIVT